MWLGCRVAAWAIFLTLDLALDPVLLLFLPLLALLAAILDLSMTTTPILPYTACYVMHKVIILLKQEQFTALFNSMQSLKFKPNRQLHLSLPSIIMTATMNKNRNKQK